MPTVTDPYRQVLECEFRQIQSAGPHSFLGYEREAKYKKVYTVVPIDNPDRFMHGLEHLISDVQSENTAAIRLEPSPYDPYEGTRYHLKNPKKYQKELEKMFKKYSGIHKRMIKTFDDEETKQLQHMLEEAKAYQPKDSITKNPNWRPGTNHHTGRPYDEYRDRDTGEWKLRSFPEK